MAELATANQPSSISQPSSPRSSALPSPPDSPAESVSSLPSVSSSFFFSSAAASPPHSHANSDHRDSMNGLIIPSLTLPSALRRPTPYGQTLGDLRLLILGSRGAGKSFLSGHLLEDNEDVVEVGNWEMAEHGDVLRASTDWIEHKDAHGLEKFEPTRNVEIIELPGYTHNADVTSVVQSVMTLIQAPFHSVSEVLHPKCQPSNVLANLLSSPCTPLCTALIFLLPSAPSSFEQLIIDNLCSQIPIIVLPRLTSQSHSRHPSLSKLSSFRPASPIALRAGLFRSPETLSTLRSEAADRFLRWREVERTVAQIRSSLQESNETTEAESEKAPEKAPEVSSRTWNKEKWESEWESTLSQDVARRLRQNTVSEANLKRFNRERSPSCVGPSFDPLHLPSLFMFSLSLLGPLQSQLRRAISNFIAKFGDNQMKVALAGGFCIGVGVGVLMKGRPF